MARVDGSSIASNVRGKVGDQVFAANRAGPFVRDYVIPSNPDTSKQQQARGVLTSAKVRWDGLTDSQRLAWGAAAESKAWMQRNKQMRNYQCSGYQLFMKLNLSLGYFATTLDDPPAKQDFPAVSMVAFETASSSPTLDATITFDAEAFSSDYRLLVNSTDNLSVGRMKARRQDFRWTIALNSGDLSSPYNIKFSWAGVWGNQPDPERIFVEAWLVSLVSGERFRVGRMGNFS